MTTRVIIENDPTSNPAQHVEVIVSGGGLTKSARLAPGEKTDTGWITDYHTVIVREHGYPKPKAE